MNTLKYNQYDMEYTITIQPTGFAFPYTMTFRSLNSAMWAIAEIKSQYGITITI